MSDRRIERLNSLLQEVISDVIHTRVKNPHLSDFVSVTRVAITRDLHHAKVYVSIIGEPAQKKKGIEALQSAAGFIAVQASKQIIIRFFPELTFILDDTVDKQAHIEDLISKIHEEKKRRQT